MPDDGIFGFGLFPRHVEPDEELDLLEKNLTRDLNEMSAALDRIKSRVSIINQMNRKLDRAPLDLSDEWFQLGDRIRRVERRTQQDLHALRSRIQQLERGDR